jgi:hypothetical protein
MLQLNVISAAIACHIRLDFNSTQGLQGGAPVHITPFLVLSSLRLRAALLFRAGGHCLQYTVDASVFYEPTLQQMLAKVQREPLSACEHTLEASTPEYQLEFCVLCARLRAA